MLSDLLYAEAPAEFFRLLAGPNAPIYVDALDALDRALADGGTGLSRAEAVEIVCEVLRQHPSFVPAEELEAASSGTCAPSEQAHTILNRLIATRWLEEPVRADYQRILYFHPNGEVVLAALRRIAQPETAQFTGKLRLVCDRLADPNLLGEFSWDDLQACLDNVRGGLQELRQMQKSVERFTRRQLAAQTLKENLQVLYDEFSESIGHNCYRELVRAQLPTKLPQARRRLDSLALDDAALERLQHELLRREPSLDAGTAMNRVRLAIEALACRLDDVAPQAEMVDERTAEFARRSFARFRYLQEVGSSRRQQVQQVFESLNQHFAGARLVDLDGEQAGLPGLLIHEVGLLTGDSLFAPRARHELAEIDPIGDDLSEEQREACLLEMERNLRNSLTVQRANEFLENLGLESGRRYASSELPIRNDDDIADLVACLLNAESSDAAFRVEVPRVDNDAANAETDRKAGYAIERIVIEKR